VVATRGVASNRLIIIELPLASLSWAQQAGRSWASATRTPFGRRLHERANAEALLSEAQRATGAIRDHGCGPVPRFDLHVRRPAVVVYH
jgi:hypothetical protein